MIMSKKVNWVVSTIILILVTSVMLLHWQYELDDKLKVVETVSPRTSTISNLVVGRSNCVTKGEHFICDIQAGDHLRAGVRSMCVIKTGDPITFINRDGVDYVFPNCEGW